MNLRRILFAATALLALNVRAQSDSFSSSGVTQINTTCAVTGGPITRTGTVQGTVAPESQSGTSSTPTAASECGVTISYSNALPIAVSLVAANWSTISNFFNFNVLATSVGAVTFTPTTGTIDGLASETFQPSQSGTIWMDGSLNWHSTGPKLTGPTSATIGHVPAFADVLGQSVSDSGKALPSGAIVGTSDVQALTNKSIAGPEVNSGTVPLAQMPAVFGFPGYITGASMFYGNPYSVAGSTGVTSAIPVANSYYCVPFWIYQTVSIKALAIQVTTLSAGNTNQALQGAVYNDMVTTGNVHRPGTLIDYAGTGSTTGFNTSVTGVVSATMNNGTDTIAGPAMIWTCVQAFDTTVKYNAYLASSAPIFGAILGSATLGRVLSANTNTGFSTIGTAFGGTNWVAFTSATSWTESVGTAIGPLMAIQVN